MTTVEQNVRRMPSCVSGGQSVGEPGSRGPAGAHGVPARLRLRHLALLLDAAGLAGRRRRGLARPVRQVPKLGRDHAVMSPIWSRLWLFSEGPSRDVILHLTTGRIHNKNVSTHLIGSISKGETRFLRRISQPSLRQGTFLLHS